MSLIAELQRRNVLRAAVGYVVGAWLIIQVVETIFPAFGFGDAAVRWVVIALAIGFLPAMVLAWVFEWTPGGLRRDQNVDQQRPDLLDRSKRFDRLVMIGLALGMAYFAVDKFLLDPVRDTQREQQIKQQARSEALVESYGDHSIAVLPFDDLSPDQDQQYLAEGIAEELLHLLASVRDLRVAGRTSTFSLASQGLTIPEIARTLNVGYILEGSIRKSGDQVRITVQLIEGLSDTHLWSETYDRQLGEIFALQDEISAVVVDSLNVTLRGKISHAQAVDPDAYVLYLQAMNLFYSQTEMNSFERSGKLLKRALEIDPDFVDAIGSYARYLWISEETLPGEESNKARVQQMIDRALSLAPSNAWILSWKAFFAVTLNNDVESYARYLERAYEANPNHYELQWSSVINLSIVGRSDLGATIGKVLLDRDPLCLFCRASTAQVHMNIGDYEGAAELLRTGLELEPSWDYGAMLLTQTLVYAGRPAEALKVAEQLVERHGPNIPGYSEALHDLGMTEQYAKVFAGYREFHKDDFPTYMAMLYAWVGENDAAFEALEQAEDPVSSFSIRSAIVRPPFRKLRDDPRMQALLEKYQLTEADISTISLNPDFPSL